MNSYEEKVERRRERLEAKADRLRGEGRSLYDRAHKMASVIPFGQPILVGHHSEKRDRNYRGKIHNTFGKAFETMKAGDEAAGKAASVGTGGISSDDPDAVTKLEAELAGLEAEQAKMVAVNKAFRKGDNAAVLALGVPASVLAIWNSPATSIWDKGYPSYRMSNNNANIRRIKQRIEVLKRNATRETKETLHNSGVRMVENAEENRVQLFFPGKPATEVRTKLKSYGFRWAPSTGAWQRQLNNRAVWVAKELLKELVASGEG